MAPTTTTTIPPVQPATPQPVPSQPHLPLLAFIVAILFAVCFGVRHWLPVGKTKSLNDEKDESGEEEMLVRSYGSIASE
jgi:hypothetical protein